MALVASFLVPMDRLGRLWPHAEPVEHTLGRLGARSARAARGGEMSRIITSDDRTFDVDVACRPVRTLHVKDGVSLVVFTTVVPYHPRRPTPVGPPYIGFRRQSSPGSGCLSILYLFYLPVPPLLLAFTHIAVL